jgi:hypothetical protein
MAWYQGFWFDLFKVTEVKYLSLQESVDILVFATKYGTRYI